MQALFFEKILPAVTFDDPAKAELVAGALRSGGLNQMEVTFRTSVAVSAIERIRGKFPDMQIGAGTLLTVEQLHQAKKAGAQFGLAPGFNPRIVKEALNIDFPFIPGVMTPSEIELAYELGCTVLKLFPSGQLGGTDMLKSLYGPYEHTGVRFIPMGGVSLENMNDYLRLANVVSVGGSWLAPESLVIQEDYQTITDNTRKAVDRLGKIVISNNSATSCL